LKKSVTDVETLGRAIQSAGAGFVVLDPRLVNTARSSNRILSRLTPRQLDILALVAEGYTNAAIAERLRLAEKSIQNQLNAIYPQLDIDRSNSAIQPRVTAALVYLKEMGRTSPLVLNRSASGILSLGAPAARQTD